MARRFFYDTEFTEIAPRDFSDRFQYKGTIDLISIGIVSEFGKHELYLCNSEAQFHEANDWVRVNVLTKLPSMPAVLQGASGLSMAGQWATYEAIRGAVLEFLAPSKDDPVELWGYYSAYDHVVLCWLFGAMVGLPPGMPMWTHDIKQLCESLGNPELPSKPENAHDALEDARWNLKAWRVLQTLQKGSA